MIVGDIAHSRVARSNVFLLETLGAKVTVVGPPEFLPPGVEHWPVSVTSDFDEALGTLVDRGHRELPIRADHVGKNLPSAQDERITVLLHDTDGVEEVQVVS